MKRIKQNILSLVLILLTGMTCVFAQEDTSNTVVGNPVIEDTTSPADTPKDPPVYVDMSDFFAGNVSVKTTAKPKAQNGVLIWFSYSALFFDKGEIVSNVLAVHNQRSEPIRFVVEVTAPEEWQLFSKRNKTYELEAGDSLFIPVRIVPKAGFSGSSRYMFSAFVYDEKDAFIGYSLFYAFTRKQMKWELSVEKSTHYLLRDENEIPFTVNIANQSPEPQAIQLQAQGLSKSFTINDSLNRNILRKPLTLTLGEMNDTTLNFIFTETAQKRNEKMVDLENYNPYNGNQIIKHNVYFRSVSPNPSETGRYMSSKKIDFIRLPNVYEASRYGSNVMPLTADMNTFNILGIQPMTNLHLFGNGQITQTSSLFYSSMLNFTQYDFSTHPFQNASLYMGYFHSKFNIQAGNVSGNLLGSIQGGKGIRGEYYINNEHRVNLFYSQGPRLFSAPDNYTAGGGYVFNAKKITASTQFGHTYSKSFSRSADIVNLTARTTLIRNHSFGIRGGFSRNNSTDTALQIKPLGYYAGANYTGRFINNRLTSGINGVYFSPDFGMYRGERMNANALNTYTAGAWLISLRNNLSRFKYAVNDSVFNVRLSNVGVFTKTMTRMGNVAPMIFYDINRNEGFDVHSRGLGLNLSSYDYNNYSRYFFNLRTGYNQAVHDEARNHFFLQTGGMLQYHTWSFMVRYNLGNFAVNREYYFSNTARNPQTINVSLRNQYELPYKGWIVQNMATYNYSTLYGSSANLMPEVYYYSRGGWRFRLFAEWALFRKKDDVTAYYLPGEETDIEEPWRGNFNLGMGIRKEFGVPVPWMKNKSYSVDFIAFYDINGNGLKDRDEKEIENAVIRLGGWEVITAENGKASMANIPGGNYGWTAFCLENLGGWFPNLPDSVALQRSGEMNVPFVRGVKVSGKVFVDREKWSAASDMPLDLSRIKITATNHKTYTTLTDKDANFSLYLPKGKYIITLDEKVLGEKFQLLQNNFEFEVDDAFDNLFIPFYIVEKKRKVRVTKFE